MSERPSAEARRRPLAVAITGGIGAGKSEALGAFARQGVPTISSDEIVHRLLREDDDVRAALVERFGTRVLDGHGRPDRAAIAEIVFADRGQLAWLEELLHPRVAQEYLRWRDELARRPDPPAVCVTEVPLLYEVGGEKRFDAVVAITAPRDLRARRSPVALEARERRLLPDDEKARRADFAYVNDGTLADLDAFVAGVVAELTPRAA
ncbi:MAG: dephospho-CoA kinase [Thermoleophilia bacterium]|nr:dephospho-CoA kinase [Thermoleophilia bacterium]